MSVELKPCPFCGHAATMEVHDSNTVISCGGYCEDVSTYGSMAYPMSDEEAVRAWNTRYERTCHMVPDETASWAMAGPAVYCDACGSAYPAAIQMRYCPSCGARIVGVDDE